MQLIDVILRRVEFRRDPPVLVALGASGQIHPKWKQIASNSICLTFYADHRKNVYDIRVVSQILNACIYKKTNTKNAYLNLLVTLLLMAPFNVLGALLSKVLPENDDLCLDNVVLAKKVSHA